jgi:hypothetical protein
MGRTTGVRFPARPETFSLHQIGSGAHPASYPVGTGDNSLELKLPEHEARHSLPFSAGGQEYVELYLHSPIRLRGLVLS